MLIFIIINYLYLFFTGTGETAPPQRPFVRRVLRKIVKVALEKIRIARIPLHFLADFNAELAAVVSGGRIRAFPILLVNWLRRRVVSSLSLIPTNSYLMMTARV